MKAAHAIFAFTCPLLYAAWWLTRCRHKNELLCMRAEEGMGLRCVRCGRTRPHPWSGEPKRYKRTQEGGRTEQPTGIERVQHEAEAAAADEHRMFVIYERQCAGERVRAKYGERNQEAK